MSQKKALIAALATAAGILGISTIACAEVPGFYAGAQLGYGHQSYTNPQYQPLLVSNLNSATSQSNSNTSNGLGGGLFVGYQFNDYIGAELGYLYWPEASSSASASGFNTTTSPATSVVNSASSTSKLDAIDLMVRGMVPFGGGFSGYIKAGAAYAQAKYSLTLNSSSGTSTTTATTNVVSGSTTADSFKPIAAVGLSYDINDNAVVDLSYTYLFGSSNNNNTISQTVNNLNNLTSTVPRASLFAIGFTYYFTGGATDDP